jgi:peptidoglycan/xylan/chitin deacetylase (PgdA/CDA1 family)
MDINDEYDVKSTFFWLVEQGKTESSYTGITMRNSDYDFFSKKLSDKRKAIISRNFENGLHRSISRKTIKQQAEIETPKFQANRNHYLLFRIPEHLNEVEEAGLRLDASLGFAEMAGFRNSYGLPIQLFNMNENRPYNFLEVSLNVMDTTFRIYHKMNITEAKKRIVSFLDRNRVNTILSILWHNNHFSDIKFKDWLHLYKTILDYLKQSHIETVTQKQLLKEFYNPE